MKASLRGFFFSCASLAAVVAVACSDDDGGRGAALDGAGPSGSGADFDGDQGGVNFDSGTGGTLGLGDVAMGGAGVIATLPDEEEDDSAFRAPVATGDHLWFANPESSRVALIDATTLEVRVLNAGFQPTYVAAVPTEDGSSSALVLNVGSQDATWFRVGEQSVDSVTFETHAGANRWAVSDSGRWAIAWSAAEKGVPLDPTEGLQDITIVDLSQDPPATKRLTVGYRPSALGFDSAESRALVVAEPGISVVELSAEPHVSAWEDLGEGAGRDVSLTPDGSHALVRRQGSREIEIVALDGGVSRTIELSAPVTDLDLSDDGSRAVAVVREQRELVVLEFPEILDAPGVFDSVVVPGEVFGSAALTSDGDTVALYTNAVDSDRVTIVDLREGDGYLGYRTVSIKAPVKSMTTTPDGEHAIALQGVVQGSAKAGSFGIIPLRAERFPRVVGTEAPTRHVSVGNSRALVTTTSSDGSVGVHAAHLIEMPSLRVDEVRLASPPTAAGLLSDLGLGYVAQSHLEGRLTILDFMSAEARTLTGFELGAKVVE